LGTSNNETCSGCCRWLSRGFIVDSEHESSPLTKSAAVADLNLTLPGEQDRKQAKGTITTNIASACRREI
jgi:hypothetical protein